MHSTLSSAFNEYRAVQRTFGLHSKYNIPECRAMHYTFSSAFKIEYLAAVVPAVAIGKTGNW